jgi:CelD/BcsL family acetyltransferase involved in cellulose biosynthesis
VIRIRLGEVSDFPALGARWRDLETRARCSVFQSWTWTGCLAAERFRDPVLMEATEGDRTVALALFNRVRGGFGQPDRLYLGESGDPAFDCPYIEHNGVLAERGREAALTEACFDAEARSHILILSGVGSVGLEAARGTASRVEIIKASESPFVGLETVRAAGLDYLAGLSANTRQQIRRSDRVLAGQGVLTARTAESATEAHEWLDEMAALHQAAWKTRGMPGSFAAPFFARFHHALIQTGFPRGQIAMTQVRAGTRTIGILYNLRDAGGIRAYQSGFDYAANLEPAAKPGMSCHHAAIRLALADGVSGYDFLAGGDRYKRSLANASRQQYWLEAGPAWSPRLLRRAISRRLGRVAPN